mgnify:CR=1 FL=1
MNKNKLFMIIGIIILLVVIVIVAVMVPQKSEEGKKKEEKLMNINYDIEGNETKLNDYDTGNPVVAMYIENYGSVVMELYPDVAPNTVDNFISLVKSGFYDNNTFHRLVPGFVLQGGDPDGTGTGGPGYSIKGEFTNNGFENNLKHTKGVISMARSNDKDSAGSQFFIMLGTSTYLDGDYAAFGKVIAGMDNVERIEKEESVSNEATGQLRKNLTIKKAIIDLKGKEYKEVQTKEKEKKEIKLKQEEVRRLKSLGERKSTFYESTDYLVKAVGLRRYSGYVAYIYKNGEVILDRKYNKDYPTTASGDAIYNMKAINFEALSKLDKVSLRKKKEVKRMIHRNNWEDRVRKIIEKEGTKEDIESAKTLVKKLKGKSI